MLTKIYNYKGVILFYILLALILFLVGMHNKNIDMHPNTNNYVENI